MASLKRLILILALLVPLCALAEEDRAVLHLPKDMLGKPMLFGSRVVSVNRPWGKVFADGQRNPRPVVMHFEWERDSMILLRPHRPRVNSPYSHINKKANVSPMSFRIAEETDTEYVLNILPLFSTYPRVVSAIPPKMLPGRAREYEILNIRETDRYFQVTGHYVYDDGLDVTAACYLVFLRETAMATKKLDFEKVAYNTVDLRMPGGGKVQLPHHWNLNPDTKLHFYVDRAFPEEWFPYIKEGLEDWNKAFHKIGYGDVIQVHPAGDSLDTTSPLTNMVRYMDIDEANAKGDVLIDPRSGEILQADILWWRNVLQLLCDWRYVQTGHADPEARRREYPIEMLGPMIRYAMCHEMGHALGLGHNMGASWAYTPAQLHDPAFTAEYGTSASVMDYARFNHFATAADVAAGVNLMPPRLGPYDYYAIACGYSDPKSWPIEYCYFAPFISAAISPDPSSQSETLSNDLLLSSRTGVDNCRALLKLDGIDEERTSVLSKNYYRYILLAMSNIGGCVKDVPVEPKLQHRTLDFVMEALATVPPELADPNQQQRLLSELDGNFLPKRIQESCGDKELKRYYRRLNCLKKRYNKQFTNTTNYVKNNR